MLALKIIVKHRVLELQKLQKNKIVVIIVKFILVNRDTANYASQILCKSVITLYHRIDNIDFF
jgi:hypothetical protein